MNRPLSKKIFLILTTIGLLIGCAPQTTSEPVFPTEVSTTTVGPTHLKISILPFLAYAPMFIAQEEGYFAAENLDVEFVTIQGGAGENLTALLSGNVDVMSGFLSSALFNAIKQNAKIQIVAGKGYISAQGCDSVALMARKDLIVDGKLSLTPAQRENLVAYYGQGTIGDYLFDISLAPDGFSTSKVESINIPFNELLTGMQSGSVDLALAGEPWVTRISKSGAGVIYKDFKKEFPDAEYSLMVFGPSILENNPDAGRRFMTAYLKALKQYQEGPTDRNIEIVMKYGQFDSAELKSVCWLPIRQDGAINIQTLIDFQNWAVKKGYMDSVLSVEQFWNPSFIEYAQTQLK